MKEFKLSEKKFEHCEGAGVKVWYFGEDVKEFIKRLKEDIWRNSKELDNKIRREYIKSPLKMRFLKELEELDKWNGRSFNKLSGEMK